MSGQHDMITLETRAEIIADSTGGRTRGTSLWKRLKITALSELRQAVAEEKERCAGVAEQFLGDSNKTPSYIADVIRTAP